MTKTEENTIRNIIARLKEPRLGAASGYVEFDEEKGRIYVDTWLVGPLEMLLPGEGRDPALAERMSGK